MIFPFGPVILDLTFSKMFLRIGLLDLFSMSFLVCFLLGFRTHPLQSSPTSASTTRRTREPARCHVARSGGGRGMRSVKETTAVRPIGEGG